MTIIDAQARRQNSFMTFRENTHVGRHGWLRLTPAYSYRLVEEAIAQSSMDREGSVLLDPFSGSGTTGLVGAEHGLRSHLVDVNPFLVWFAGAKTRNYTPKAVQLAEERAIDFAVEGPEISGDGLWQPDLHHIERWWNSNELEALRVLHHLVSTATLPVESRDLLLVAFCRTLIAVSNAAFNHQSMSFKDETPANSDTDTPAKVWDVWAAEAAAVIGSASVPLSGQVECHLGDARELARSVTGKVDLLYTSPPYANRMSYIRELRPYMYWLGYLTEARQAGELDWTAIGGTWGIATSRVAGWEAEEPVPLSHNFGEKIQRIQSAQSKNGDLLSRYVHKYTADMWQHFRSAHEVLQPGARAIYIVGNSTFFGEVVPVEQWYGELMEQSGFGDIKVEAIRKRNSKKALFEFAVSGTRR